MFLIDSVILSYNCISDKIRGLLSNVILHNIRVLFIFVDSKSDYIEPATQYNFASKRVGELSEWAT